MESKERISLRLGQLVDATPRVQACNFLSPLVAQAPPSPSHTVMDMPAGTGRHSTKKRAILCLKVE